MVQPKGSPGRTLLMQCLSSLEDLPPTEPALNEDQQGLYQMVSESNHPSAWKPSLFREEVFDSLYLRLHTLSQEQDMQQNVVRRLSECAPDKACTQDILYI
ncbi:MAG: hypothetical protein AAGJ35_15915 [Myxococcota bacterium]